MARENVNFMNKSGTKHSSKNNVKIYKIKERRQIESVKDPRQMIRDDLNNVRCILIISFQDHNSEYLMYKINK
jgi:hypothetical protein